MHNLIPHAVKYLLVTLLVWAGFKFSNIGIGFVSCLFFCSAVAMLEWLFKVWMIEQLNVAVNLLYESIVHNTRKLKQENKP